MEFGAARGQSVCRPVLAFESCSWSVRLSTYRLLEAVAKMLGNVSGSPRKPYATPSDT